MTVDRNQIQDRLKELAERQWDTDAIRGRVAKLLADGIQPKRLEKSSLMADRDEILKRVQRHAEEYNFLFHNCPKGTALALLEEFGLGSMEIIKALTPFPGLGGTGRTCGGVTGGLIAIGLAFGNTNVNAGENDIEAIIPAQQFLTAFQDQFGFVNCAEIQEHVVFGRNMNPGAGPENMAAFAEAKGFEKCGLVPGIGASLAAEVIINTIIV